MCILTCKPILVVQFEDRMANSQIGHIGRSDGTCICAKKDLLREEIAKYSDVLRNTNHLGYLTYLNNSDNNAKQANGTTKDLHNQNLHARIQGSSSKRKRKKNKMLKVCCSLHSTSYSIVCRFRPGVQQQNCLHRPP